MKKLLLLIMLLICVTLTASASETIDVKDYIKGKFPVIFNIYLASLGELDEYEKEFIDLLQNLPKEEQKNFAKEVYDNGFSKEILEEMKTKDIITKTETEIEEKDVEKIPFAQDREFEYDFRKTNWGMSPKQVRAVEVGKLYDKSGNSQKRTLWFLIKESGWGNYRKYLYALYFFLEDELWCARYVTLATFTDKYEWIREHRDWQFKITEKYGEFLANRGKWYGPYLKDPAKWGIAVSVGDIEFNQVWRTSTTGIELRLWGDDGQSHLHITYTDLTHMSQEFRELEYPKEEDGENSIGYKLCVIDGDYEKEDSVKVRRYNYLLETLAQKCSCEEINIADISVENQKILREKYGKEVKILTLLEAANEDLEYGSSKDDFIGYMMLVIQDLK